MAGLLPEPPRQDVDLVKILLSDGTGDGPPRPLPGALEPFGDIGITVAVSGTNLRPKSSTDHQQEFPGPALRRQRHDEHVAQVQRLIQYLLLEHDLLSSSKPVSEPGRPFEVETLRGFFELALQVQKDLVAISDEERDRIEDSFAVAVTIRGPDARTETPPEIELQARRPEAATGPERSGAGPQRKDVMEKVDYRTR